MKKILCAVLGIWMLLSLLISGSVTALADGTVDIDNLDASAWMGFLPGDVYLSALNVPGTHDSGLFLAAEGFATFAQCQRLSIAEQLEAGVRFFDLRLRYAGDPDDVGKADEIKQLYVCHGQGAVCCDGYLWETDSKGNKHKINYTYEMVLDEMATFLEAHPSETIFYFVRNEKLTDKEKEATEGSNFKLNNCYKDVLAYDEQKLADRFANGEKDASGNPLHSFSVLDSEYNYYEFYLMSLDEARGRMFRFENEYGFGSMMNGSKFNDWDAAYNDKWDALKPFFDTAPAQTMRLAKTRKYQNEAEEKAHHDTFRAAWTSCTGVYTYDENGKKTWNNVGVETIDVFDWVKDGAGFPTGGQEAEHLNPLLMDYGFDLGAYYGWIAMDMVTPDLARLIFRTNDFNQTGTVISMKKTAYIKDVAGFCDMSYDDAVQLCYARGYTPIPARVNTNGRVCYDMNPDGYPIVIGYTTTTNRAEAATDIVGRYDDDKPGNYSLVTVYNSLRNNFTRGTGWFTESTYLFVQHDASKTPITALEIIYGTKPGSSVDMVTRDLDGDRPVGSKEVFNLQEGVEIDDKDLFVGLKMIREDTQNRFATIFGTGNIIIILACIGMLVLAILWMLEKKKNKKLTKELEAAKAAPDHSSAL